MGSLISTHRTGRKGIFLDRDGTINREVNFLRDPGQVRLLPGAADAIRRLNETGFAVVILTNQSGIARGLLDEETLDEIHRVLLTRLARRGAVVDGVYYCPHHPEEGDPPYRRRCTCRKPEKGMLHQAVQDLGIPVEGSYVIGDNERDVALAEGTPLASVLLAPKSRRPRAGTSADHVASTLAAAVDWVLSRAGRTRNL